MWKERDMSMSFQPLQQSHIVIERDSLKNLLEIQCPA